MSMLRAILPVLSALLIGGCAVLHGNRDAARTGPANGYAPQAAPGAGNTPPSDTAGEPSATADAAAATPGLWKQMRQGFRLDGEDHARVERQIRAYSRNPAQVEKVFKRASPYMAYILGEVQQRGFPTSLALLPFVESGYDPFAYSTGRAAGLWQFIPGTGKSYGLEQDWWYDGRRDVVASTQAALDHLGSLHQEFDGDWLLALAAYNAGSGTVHTAIGHNRKAGRPTDYWHLRLPAQTMDYVPRLLAIREIVQHPGRYGVSLEPIEASPSFIVVDIDGQIDLGIAAELAGMKTGELLQLNPGFNRLATHPDGPQQLAIPVDRLGTFLDNLDNLPDDKRIRSVRHTVKRGETLSGIAARYHTRVQVLQASNHLRGTLIRPGQDLLIRTGATTPNELALLPQQRVAIRSVHTVRNGESLWSISRRYGVSVSQLRGWNGLSGHSVIRPGQHLRIAVRSANPHVRTIHYTVRRGDSLYRIAKKFEVSVRDLRRWNELKSDTLVPGQHLQLHIDVTDLARND
jgi:membrane-bound lytic murein transglycosylase D